MSEVKTVTIGSEEYAVALTIGAMMDFEEATGRNVLKLVATSMGAVADAQLDLGPSETVAEAIVFVADGEMPSGETLEEASRIAADIRTRSRRGARIFQAVFDALDLSMNDFATLLWACVGGGEEGSTLTPRGIAGQVGPGNVMQIGQALADAVMAAMPKRAEGDDSEIAGAGDDPTRPPTG